MRNWYVFPIAVGMSLTACVRIPPGPNVMALPGAAKSFDQFVTDDSVCRDWAARQTGTTPNQASTEAGAKAAAIGTGLGAASGAAIGAAAGHPATGAAVGAGVGLLGGTAAGAGYAGAARWSVQDRYDAAYMQCMYAKGNQIPIPRGSLPTSSWHAAALPARPSDVPPPPRGAPPPPPPAPSP